MPEFVSLRCLCGDGSMCAMTIRATVQGDMIKLPAGVHLADGTNVEIVAPSEGMDKDSPLAWMAEFAGSIDTLPPDAAERHTEYAHGRKRRLP